MLRVKLDTAICSVFIVVLLFLFVSALWGCVPPGRTVIAPATYEVSCSPNDPIKLRVDDVVCRGHTCDFYHDGVLIFASRDGCWYRIMK